jgi:hypothetical protein
MMAKTVRGSIMKPSNGQSDGSAGSEEDRQEVLPSEGLSADELELMKVLGEILPYFAVLDADLHKAASSAVKSLRRRAGVGEFDPQRLEVISPDA